MSKTSLTELLQLTSAPVAITFVDMAPPGVPHVSAVEPAGWGYWRRAAAGEVFFTVADDHKRCPVGAHTHNVTLSPAEQQELMGLVHLQRRLARRDLWHILYLEAHGPTHVRGAAGGD